MVNKVKLKPKDKDKDKDAKKKNEHDKGGDQSGKRVRPEGRSSSEDGGSRRPNQSQRIRLPPQLPPDNDKVKTQAAHFEAYPSSQFTPINAPSITGPQLGSFGTPPDLTTYDSAPSSWQNQSYYGSSSTASQNQYYHGTTANAALYTSSYGSATGIPLPPYSHANASPGPWPPYDHGIGSNPLNNISSQNTGYEQSRPHQGSFRGSSFLQKDFLGNSSQRGQLNALPSRSSAAVNASTSEQTSLRKITVASLLQDESATVGGYAQSSRYLERQPKPNKTGKYGQPIESEAFWDDDYDDYDDLSDDEEEEQEELGEDEGNENGREEAEDRPSDSHASRGVGKLKPEANQVRRGKHTGNTRQCPICHVIPNWAKDLPKHLRKCHTKGRTQVNEQFSAIEPERSKLWNGCGYCGESFANGLDWVEHVMRLGCRRSLSHPWTVENQVIGILRHHLQGGEAKKHYEDLASNLDVVADLTRKANGEFADLKVLLQHLEVTNSLPDSVIDDAVRLLARQAICIHQILDIHTACSDCTHIISAAAVFEPFDSSLPTEEPRRNNRSGFRSLKCEHCGGRIQTVDSLRQHPLDVHPGIKVPCKICKEGIASMKDWKDHRKIRHSKLSSVPCPSAHCNSPLGDTTRNSIMHLQRHHPGLFYDIPPRPRYQCKKCPSHFDTSTNLNHHMNVVHKEARKQFRCPVSYCRQTRFIKETMQSHIAKSHPNLKGSKAEPILEDWTRETTGTVFDTVSFP